MNFREFLALTADDDREFLSSNDKTKLHETICAMSNGLGGWIILDDVFDYETADLKIYRLRVCHQMENSWHHS